MQRLFQPVDIASLILLRIIFGILGFADVFGTWIYYHMMKGAFAPEAFQFKYYGFEWVKPLPEPFMSILLLSICACAILVALGKWYRISATLFAFGFTYTYFLEKAHYLNHGYLFCWISFLMIFLPVDRQLSLDVKKNPDLKSDTAPYWCLFIPQFLMGIVYFFGGIAKLNSDWLHAIPLKQWIGYRTGHPLIGLLLEQEWMAYFMAYGGLLLDLFVVFFLVFKRTRPWAFAAVLFFHFMNLLVFSIGIFPFLSVTLTALYFAPDFPRRFVHWLAGRWDWLNKQQSAWISRIQSSTEKIPMWQAAPRNRTLILSGLGVLMAIHLLLPLRHHLYPGDVAWTEEGHRYSWRMMLRSKIGFGKFQVVNQDTGEKTIVRPRDYLSERQERKLYTHPDMILQFAHFLEKEFETEGQEVAVYANIRCKLNYRDYHDYIDPERDLTQLEWSFWAPSDWILPE
ncbi:HTTM domain-containing protein [Phaeodactylibacter xiamenensis]|uniref:HTTM domain-containing protein n=1 Tax=Phaeodactylibacter xiamenensis TaxID=1524460 RepID=UPI003CCB8514